MEQYGLASHFVDVIVSDFSRPLWRTGFEIDAIITDRKIYNINSIKC